eukprot:COSAG05_NODE_54_length_23549_cov_81.790840_10_plen_75_part_00
MGYQAEIQEYKQDRSLMLHTRANGLHGKVVMRVFVPSLIYARVHVFTPCTPQLTRGILIRVPPHLIKRLKHHCQ